MARTDRRSPPARPGAGRATPRPVAHPGREVGGVRAAREEHDRPAARAADVPVAAGLGPRVLAVDRTDGAAAAEPVLDHLPVARVAAGAEDPAVLRVGGEEHPVLQPASGAAAVEG